MLAANERVLQARAALESQGISLSVRDASLEKGYPVVAIILYLRHQGTAFVSFGAHPIFEVALERTLTEAFQGRALDRLVGFQPPSDDLDWIQSVENLETHFIDASGQFHWRFFAEAVDFAFSDWGVPATASLEDQWAYLLEKLEQLDQPLYGQVYAAEGFYACRMIAPGISEVFPLDEVVSNNQNRGCALRKHLQQFESSAAWAEALLALLDEFEWAEHLSVPSTIGLVVSEENPWRGIKMIDLRLAAYCMLKEWAEVEAWLESALYLSQDMLSRHGAYQALARLLEGEDLSTYQSALHALYGKTCTELAQHWFAGEGFWGLPVGAALLQDPRHQQLWQTHPGASA